MSRITLHDKAHRARAVAMVVAAPFGWRVEVAEPKRNDDQNKKMWAMVGDVLEQRGDWFGPGLDADDLKQVFMSSMFKELRMARNADGDGYVPLTRRSSKLSIRQMADLITLIGAWGDQHGVIWTEWLVTDESTAGGTPAKVGVCAA